MNKELIARIAAIIDPAAFHADEAHLSRRAVDGLRRARADAEEKAIAIITVIERRAS